MAWTQYQINSHFHNDQAFVANYCSQHTLDKLQIGPNPANLGVARFIAKRLAQLMPHGAHGSPIYTIKPCPWAIVSSFTGHAGKFNSGRVAVFQSNNQFFLGLRCTHTATAVNGLAFPPEVQGILILAQYEWLRLNLQNDHLCIQLEIPENGQFIHDHPLADGQPLALALQWIDANKFVPIEVDYPTRYENFLIARNQPLDSVITPRVMSYQPGDHPGVQLPG